jgi:hypothetical protein
MSAAGAAATFGSSATLADEGPPEVTTIRLTSDVNICLTPWYIAEELLRAEGFIDIRSAGDQVPIPRQAARRLHYTASWLASS